MRGCGAVFTKLSVDEFHNVRESGFGLAMQVASRAAESRKPVILAINKIDAIQTVAVLVLGSGLVSGCHDLTNYVIRNTGILTSRNQRVFSPLWFAIFNHFATILSPSSYLPPMRLPPV